MSTTKSASLSNTYDTYEAHTIYTGEGDVSGLEDIQHFSGFYENIYRDPFVGGNAFVFVTRPQLFLNNDENIAKQNKDTHSYLALENMTKEPKFTQFMLKEISNDLDKSIFDSLSIFSNFSSSFLPMFTNQCKNFDTMNTMLDSIDAFETKQGFKEMLPSFKTVSESANQLSISVTEDSNLSFTKLMTLWVNYISNVTDGTFNANPEMIANGILDYTSSIYYFVLGPDGQSIKYWARYTGCWPTTIPYGNLRYSKGVNETVELELPFVYTVKEDMDPMILEDFNILSLGLANNEISSLTSETITQGYAYSSLETSQFLSLQSSPGGKGAPDTKLAQKLKEFSNDSETRHDPVIIYKKTGGSQNRSFQLVFDKYGYTYRFISQEFGDVLSTESNDYAYTFKNSNGGSSGASEYNSWKEETIV